jgi:hypothetical protein
LISRAGLLAALLCASCAGSGQGPGRVAPAEREPERARPASTPAAEPEPARAVRLDSGLLVGIQPLEGASAVAVCVVADAGASAAAGGRGSSALDAAGWGGRIEALGGQVRSGRPADPCAAAFVVPAGSLAEALGAVWPGPQVRAPAGRGPLSARQLRELGSLRHSMEALWLRSVGVREADEWPARARAVVLAGAVDGSSLDTLRLWPGGLPEAAALSGRGPAGRPELPEQRVIWHVRDSPLVAGVMGWLVPRQAAGVGEAQSWQALADWLECAPAGLGEEAAGAGALLRIELWSRSLGEDTEVFGAYFEGGPGSAVAAREALTAAVRRASSGQDGPQVECVRRRAEQRGRLARGGALSAAQELARLLEGFGPEMAIRAPGAGQRAEAEDVRRLASALQPERLLVVGRGQALDARPLALAAARNEPRPAPLAAPLGAGGAMPAGVGLRLRHLVLDPGPPAMGLGAASLRLGRPSSEPSLGPEAVPEALAGRLVSVLPLRGLTELGCRAMPASDGAGVDLLCVAEGLEEGLDRWLGGAVAALRAEEGSGRWSFPESGGGALSRLRGVLFAGLAGRSGMQAGSSAASGGPVPDALDLAVAVVGDFEPAAIERVIRGRLGAVLPPAPTPRAAAGEPRWRSGEWVERRPVEGAWLVCGHPAPAAGSPDEPGVAVGIEVLLGAVRGRLTEVLHAAGPAWLAAAYQRDGGGGRILLELGVGGRDRERGTSAMTSELRRLRAQGPTQAELRAAQRRMAGQRELARSSLTGRAGLAAAEALQRRGIPPLEGARLEALDASAVQRAMGRWLPELLPCAALVPEPL